MSDELESNLTTSERMVVDVINTDEQHIVNMSIVEVAELTFTSTTTVHRALKKCGFVGFSEFRYKLLNRNKKNKNYVEYKGVSSVLEKSLIEVTRTLESISLKDVINTVRLLKQSKRVYIYSLGG